MNYEGEEGGCCLEEPCSRPSSKPDQIVLCSGASQRALCQDKAEIKNQCSSHDEACCSDVQAAEEIPSWESLQSISFASWTSTLCRDVLRTKTPFAAFLRSSLSVRRSTEVGSDKALFPLPVPKEGIFVDCSKGGSRCRRRRAFDRALHVIVMALNFWHADFRFVPVSELSKIPSSSQSRCLVNMRNLLKACGNCQELVSVPSSGRRTTSLTAQLADLCEFLTWQGASADPYRGGFQGADSGLADVWIQPDKTRDESLTPYRSLDASRLKLSGSGAWDPTSFLSDALWMAYVEPASLVFRSDPGTLDVPDLTKEDGDEVLALAKVWDARGLLFLVHDQPDMTPTSMRFFNCYKAQQVDRMIGDRRARNAIEGIIPGASRALPTAVSLACLEIDPAKERFSVCISDRKDFYHQFKVSPERAKTNVCYPPLPLQELADTSAFAAWAQDFALKKRKKYDRLLHGDFLGKDRKPQPMCDVSPDMQVRVCFASLPQGDALGVEFAVDSHRALMASRGLLPEINELRSDRVFRGDKDLCGLVIDDFYTLSILPAERSANGASWACTTMQSAQNLYQSEGLLGSSEKDVYDADFAKVTGAELDSSESTRALGLATLASPWKKRMSLSFLSLKLAALRYTTDRHLCLLGGWVHSLLYRRPMMSVLAEAFHLVSAQQVDQEKPRVIPLPRKVAQELTILAVLAPLMTTDLSAVLQSEVYATDASDAKGAIVKTHVTPTLARALWRSGRKKGGYVRMLSREQALVQKLDFLAEQFPEEQDHEATLGPQKPLALRFHFIEVCGGSGKVSACVAERGWVVGPVLDLDRSPHYDFKSLRVLSWIFHLLEEGLLDACMLEPPCTTFSPAQHPASRSYELPRGFDPTDEKTHLGTMLALRALAVLWKACQVEALALLEQPRKSKMRRLSEWEFLVASGLAQEFITASCMFGSIHLKEFVFLACGLEGESLCRRCSKDHEHVQIAGQWTKPSATYVDALAQELAETFHKALLRKLRVEHTWNYKKGGLENPLCNDVLLSASWKPVRAWRWPRPRHINIQESTVVEVLLRQLALDTPKTRQVIALDSNVGLSSLVKGRSSSKGLQPVLRRVGATVVVGSLYPAYHFSPTRWNPADHPTRDNEMPEPLKSGLDQNAELPELLDFARGESLRRPYANWVRLFSLLRPGPYPWFSVSESWRFMHHKLRHFPFRYSLRHVCQDFSVLDFDSTLGFPGEGPSLCLWIWIFFVFLPRSPGLGSYVAWTFHVFSDPVLSFSGPLRFGSLDYALPWTMQASWNFASLQPELPPSTSKPEPCRSVRPSHQGIVLYGFSRLWTLRLVSLVSVFECSSAVSHGVAVLPRDAGDKRRAASRGILELPTGRPVLGQTQKQRDVLVAGFDEWLKGEGFSLQEILFVAEPDVETLNIQLERFGRLLYRAGRPYNHYVETINGLTGKRPRVRSATTCVGPGLCLAQKRAAKPSPCLAMASTALNLEHCTFLGMAVGCRHHSIVLGWAHKDWRSFGCLSQSVGFTAGCGKYQRFHPPPDR